MAQRSRFERYAPLTGLAFVLGAIVAIAVAGDTPDADAKTAKVVAYWTKHDGKHMFDAFWTVLGAVLLVWFGASLQAFLRRGETGRARLSVLPFAGTVLAAAGLLVSAGVEFSAADTAGDVPPQVTQTLSVLNEDLFIPFFGGLVVLALAAGFAIVSSRVLPVWLGWVAVAAAVAMFTPAGFIGFLVIGVWIAVVSVLVYRAGALPEGPATAPMPQPPPGAPT